MLFLDSAAAADARVARAMGWVGGITTNPALMAATGRAPHQQLQLLLEAFPAGPILVQPSHPSRAESELRLAFDVGADRVVAKLPAQSDMFSLGCRLAADGHQVAFTAVYSPAQAVVASESGAAWVIPYVDRATRLRPEVPIVAALRAALDATGSPARLLAASLKTPEQVVAAFVDGADAITAALAVLQAMTQDPLTDRAVQEFADAAG